MIYERQLPSPELRPWVGFYWYFEQSSGQPAVEHVLPDGSFELVVNLLDDARKLFDPAGPSPVTSFRRAWLSGAQSRYLLIDRVQVARMTGVHFCPGGAAAFLEAPAGEFQDTVVQTSAVWAVESNRLRERLLEAPDSATLFAELERFLRERFHPPALQRGAERGITWAIGQLAGEPDGRQLNSLSRELGISQKHFIHLFRNRVGLTPKVFCRIRRFQRALAEIQTRARIDWAEIACEAGYYDQSHFVHDFRNFSGLNPTIYLKHTERDTRFVAPRAR